MKAKHVGITLRWSLDDDVGTVIRTLRKQFREACPRIVQLRLVVKSNNRDCRVLIVVGNGDAPEIELVCIDVAEVVGLFSSDKFLEGGDCLCRFNLDLESIRYGFAINDTE